MLSTNTSTRRRRWRTSYAGRNAHASAKTIPIDLMAALDLVEHQVARTAREIKVGRCFAGDHVREISGTMGPLLVAAWIAARLQDDLAVACLFNVKQDIACRVRQADVRGVPGSSLFKRQIF